MGPGEVRRLAASAERGEDREVTVLAWTPWMEAVARLVEAHPGEFARHLERATARAEWAECATCTGVSAEARALADLLGHDRLGHSIVYHLALGGICSIPDLVRALPVDRLLEVHGVGEVSLERIRRAVAAVEQARPAGPAPPVPRGYG